MLTAQNESHQGKVQNFTLLFEGGKRWKGRLFQAVYRRPAAHTDDATGQGGEPAVRWAVIASKKGVDKRATRRNFVKRRLRALVREVVLPGLVREPMAPGAERLEFALIAGRRMLEEPWPSLENEMRTFLGILNNAGQEPRP